MAQSFVVFGCRAMWSQLAIVICWFVRPEAYLKRISDAGASTAAQQRNSLGFVAAAVLTEPFWRGQLDEALNMAAGQAVHIPKLRDALQPILDSPTTELSCDLNDAFDTAMRALSDAEANSRSGACHEFRSQLLQRLKAWGDALLGSLKQHRDQGHDCAGLAAKSSQLLAEASLCFPHEAWVAKLRFDLGRWVQSQGLSEHLARLMSSMRDIGHAFDERKLKSLTEALDSAEGIKVGEDGDAVDLVASTIDKLSQHMLRSLGEYVVSAIPDCQLKLLKTAPTLPDRMNNSLLALHALHLAAHTQRELDNMAKSAGSVQHAIEKDSESGFKRMQLFQQRTQMAEQSLAKVDDTMRAEHDANVSSFKATLDAWMVARTAWATARLQPRIDGIKNMAKGDLDGKSWTDGLDEHATLPEVFDHAEKHLAIKPQEFVKLLGALREEIRFRLMCASPSRCVPHARSWSARIQLNVVARLVLSLNPQLSSIVLPFYLSRPWPRRNSRPSRTSLRCRGSASTTSPSTTRALRCFARRS